MSTFSSRSPGLVRNISLPALRHPPPNPFPPPPASPLHPRVPRVSSFSTISKPPLYRTPPPDDSDSDGLVPQLPHPSHDPPSSPSVTPPSSPSSVYPLPSTLPPTPLSLFLDPLVHLIFALSRTLLPPDARSHPRTHRRTLSLVTLSLLIALSASAFSLMCPPLIVHTLALFLTPILPRMTGSLAVSTLTAAATVLLYAVRAAMLVSPAMLVWASLVPLITFSGMGTRAGMGASMATAAVVAKVNVAEGSEEIGTGMVIASWVLFLGVVGVVQKGVRCVANKSA
eukprot:GFKZ01013638.1.p1 GENE.GFKZ01013638.1~~GFKZ01013638.1.p1  ORF type:complete len:284 (-),score=33.02 GFKZ01013638.1:1012-1863(-)